MTTYAVKWREPDGQTYVGRLALGERTLRLVGRGRGAKAGTVDRQIGYSELRGLRVGNGGSERLDGRPALVVEDAHGHYLVADAGIGVPMLQEVVDRLADLRLAATRTATVVVPLKPGAIERVRRLVAEGPPFDPVDTQLARHELLLTPLEAIFVFEAETEDGLGALLAQFDLLAVAAAWSDVVAGPPRIADVAYAWERPGSATSPSPRNRSNAAENP